MGVSLSNLFRLFRLYGWPEKGHRGTALMFALSALVRLPFALLDAAYVAMKRNGVKPDPVFIIGHWRSGTTLLHNLLSRDPGFSTITFRHTVLPWDFLNRIRIGARILEAALPEKRGMDDVPLALDSPQEEEMALGNMGPLCYYYCYYFPQFWRREYRRSILFEGVTEEELDLFADRYRYLLGKLSLENKGGKRILLKNPANTGRIHWLKKVFPNARFVHIHRNPYEVFASTVKHFHRILPDFAMQPFADLDYQLLTLENYRLLFEQYFRVQHEVSQEDLLEVTFADVESDPLRVVEGIYRYFHLPDRDAALASVSTYVEGTQGYRRNRYSLGRDQVARIEREWSLTLDRWGYTMPAAIEVVD